MEGSGQQPGSVDACGIQKCWVPVRCTKSVGNKELRSMRRRWRKEQLECLHRRAKARLVRGENGRYEEKQGSGGISCLRRKGSPVCMMLLVHGVYTFAFSRRILRRVKYSVYDKRLGNDH